MFERSAPAPVFKTGPLYVGVDIGKDWLDACSPGLKLRVPNTKEGYGKLLTAARSLKKRLQFVCEPTGRYAQAFINFLHSRRCRLSLISGSRLRHFARATNRHAKTDAIDSQVLSELGRTLRLRAQVKPDPKLVRLRQILRRRFQVLRTLVKQRQQKPDLTTRVLRRNVEVVERALAAELIELEFLAEQVVTKHPTALKKILAFSTVKGVGRLTATIILAEMPELGQLNRRQAAALAGLAPFNRDSGVLNGTRHIFGGRRRARTALYLSAVAASRFNPVVAPFYRRLRRKGKPGKVALVAAARKILCRLNQIARDVDQGVNPISIPRALLLPTSRRRLTNGRKSRFFQALHRTVSRRSRRAARESADGTARRETDPRASVQRVIA